MPKKGEKSGENEVNFNRIDRESVSKSYFKFYKEEDRQKRKKQQMLPLLSVEEEQQYLELWKGPVWQAFTSIIDKRSCLKRGPCRVAISSENRNKQTN